MAQIKPLSGRNLEVRRKNGAAWDLVCVASTKRLQKTNEFDDASVIDCDNPQAVPVRRSVKKMTAWTINISGTTGGSQMITLDADCDSETPITYRFVKVASLADGGGHWEGDVWFENLEFSTEENGIVKFTGQLRGEGPLDWTPVTP
ncbi:hypothetical protein [Enterovirga rhinocerotis]|uniref:Phage tail tube protein n=1 Tax=Enterovirga rhinocerotis TaxID=1339210 RepID=A0A4R7C6J9_9HYPH|nr:hypothetical protein [Enterovirga rhinocerotis]TDR94204.1 hypothetical protein EV668_1484 [Enterovirga rhinocerotis]